MVKKSSKELIKEFLSMHNISLDIDFYLPKKIDGEFEELPEDIVKRIIGDAYGSKNKIVKKITNFLVKQHNLFLGRVQKEQLKKFLDYRFPKDYETLLNLIKQDLPSNLDFKKIINKLDDGEKELNLAVSEFINNLNEAILKNRKDRIKDYIIFLYSRLISLNEKSKISLNELFSDNEHIIKKELSPKDYEELRNFCNNFEKKPRFEIINKFNEKYLEILHRNGDRDKKAGLVYINITQELFEKFNDEELFYDYLLNLVKKSYDLVENHKSLIFRISNIFVNGINIKWKLYSYLSIYAEKFKESKELRAYYKGVEILKDTFEHKYGITFPEEELELINKLLLEKISFNEFKQKTKIDEKYHSEILSFQKINHGFSFIDCYILKTKTSKNSDEINFIKNFDDIVLIFAKHKIDDRKIPCPVCGSLKISGNSYPEIGIKSWECKNPLCSERSKTNRGKRYSERTILMQDATFDFSSENQIPKSLIKIWRKDIVEKWNLNQFYEMIVKYFTFVGDKIISIQPEESRLLLDVCNKNRRELVVYAFNEILDFNSFKKGLFKEFFENSWFVKRFIYRKKNISFNPKFNEEFKSTDRIKIIKGDCLEVLNSIDKNSVDHMVTSPPYYNAREYSQWKNLYNYLNDMYQINIKAYESLKPGAVFFYNIGDIYDNENIIVKSKMGEKRIPLGAYTIFLFLKAGFEILDNILWYKGEPQSNRHKNDGNYTPYYQRPANSYEHMFIFKKKGKLILNENKNENILTENIVRFTPVYKIGKGGENRYGHTAPFPKILPKYSISCFTNKGAIVVDPFSGSGTTAIVAAKMGRIGIGIELNPDYYELSLQKIKEELNFGNGSRQNTPHIITSPKNQINTKISDFF
ncbi:site-specific DNA-methyltransferase [Candidatus Woesearchaeota archaeon]|nr:MAG: site-specific DNA-methyltransferase [Candidatus Woesearchaeota archaeon]